MNEAPNYVRKKKGYGTAIVKNKRQKAFHDSTKKLQRSASAISNDTPDVLNENNNANVFKVEKLTNYRKKQKHMTQLPQQIDKPDTLFGLDEYKEVLPQNCFHSIKKLTSTDVIPDLPDTLDPIDENQFNKLPKPESMTNIRKVLEEERKNPEIPLLLEDKIKSNLYEIPENINETERLKTEENNNKNKSDLKSNEGDQNKRKEKEDNNNTEKEEKQEMEEKDKNTQNNKEEFENLEKERELIEEEKKKLKEAQKKLEEDLREFEDKKKMEEVKRNEEENKIEEEKKENEKKLKEIENMKNELNEKEKKLKEIEQEQKEKENQFKQKEDEIKQEKEKNIQEFEKNRQELEKNKQEFELNKQEQNKKLQEQEKDLQELERNKKLLEEYQKNFEQTKKNYEEKEKENNKLNELNQEKERLEKEKKEKEISEKEKKMLDEIEKIKKELADEKKRLSEEKRISDEEREKMRRKQEEINQKMIKIEEDKNNLEEEKRKFEEEKRRKEEKFNEEFEKEKNLLKKEKREIEEEKIQLKKEKERQEDEKRKIKEEKHKQEEEKSKINEEKEKLEEEKKKLENMENEIKKIEDQRNRNDQLSNLQSDQICNFISKDSDNQLKKNTIPDSEILDQEIIEVESKNNNNMNSIESMKNKKSNNYANTNENNNDNDINIYQKINDKEVSNKLKYELQKDLLNKQKRSYNIAIYAEPKNKSAIERNQNYFNNNNDSIGINHEKKRNKLCLMDLEKKKDKKIKDIESLLNGGVDDNKLMKLENMYKDNKEIMKIILNYKRKKANYNINNNNLIEEESSSNSLNVLNINKKRKPYRDEVNAGAKSIKYRPKSGKISRHNNASLGNSINNHNYNQSSSSIQDYCDLSPFYYISNGNKLTKNMWGYNDNNYKNNEFNQSHSLNQGQIIQNKINIYREKMYKPFFDKIEREKNKEYERAYYLKSIKDPKIKKHFEKKYGIVRGIIDHELNKERDKINRAIRDYKAQLLFNESENRNSIKKNNFISD